MSATTKSTLNSDLDTALNKLHGSKMDEGAVANLLDSLLQTALVNSGKTAAFNATEEGIHGVDVSSSTITVTLDDDVAKKGFIVGVLDEEGNASTNNITVDTESSQTIDGSSSITLSTNHVLKLFYSDGTDFYTIN